MMAITKMCIVLLGIMYLVCTTAAAANIAVSPAPTTKNGTTSGSPAQYASLVVLPIATGIGMIIHSTFC